MGSLSIIIGRPSDNVPLGLVPTKPNYFLCSNPLVYRLQRKDYSFATRSDDGGFLALTGASNVDLGGFTIVVGGRVRVYNTASGVLPANLRGEGVITAVDLTTHTFTTDIPYNSGTDAIFVSGWFFTPNLKGTVDYGITAKIDGYDLAYTLTPDPDGITVIDIGEIAKAALAVEGERTLNFPEGYPATAGRDDRGQVVTSFVSLIEYWEDTVHPNGVEIATDEPVFVFLAGAGQLTAICRSNMLEYSRDTNHFGGGASSIFPGNYPIVDSVPNAPFNGGGGADLEPGQRTLETRMTYKDLSKPTYVGGADYKHPEGDYDLHLNECIADSWSFKTYVVLVFRLGGIVVLQKEFWLDLSLGGATIPGIVDGDPLVSGGGPFNFVIKDVPVFDMCTLYYKNAEDATAPLTNFIAPVIWLRTKAKFINKFKQPYMYRGYPFTLSFLDQVFDNPDTDVDYDTLRLEMKQFDKLGNDITPYGSSGVDHYSYVAGAPSNFANRLSIFSSPFVDEDGNPDIKNPYVLPNAVKLEIALRCDADNGPDIIVEEDYPTVGVDTTFPNVYPNPKLTQTLTISVEEPCDEGILIFWKGWNGADHYYMFSKFFERQHQYQDGRAVRRMLLAAEDLSVDDWEVLNELNSSNLMYRSNITDMSPTKKADRVGNLIYAVGVDFEITGLIVIPTESKLKNKNERRRIEILAEFPELYQP